MYKYKISNLEEGFEYQIRIAAANFNRTSSQISKFLVANATVQSTMPSDLTITAHQTKVTSVLVRWNPPSVPVLNYIIRRIDETDHRLLQNPTYTVPGSSKAEFKIVCRGTAFFNTNNFNTKIFNPLF